MQKMRKTQKKLTTTGACKGQTGRSAFTMIEILVVIMIIAILLGIGVGVGKMLLAEADKTLTITNMKIITSALERYKDETGDYPPQTGDDYWATPLFDDSVSTCKSILIEINSDYIKKDGTNYIMLDGFDNAIQYSKDGGLAGMPRLTSYGPDGVEGTAGSEEEKDNIYSDKE
jgi:general secretion pathway protein G